MFWSCIDVIVVRVKDSRGIDSADIIKRPMRRFAWTNHITSN